MSEGRRIDRDWPLLWSHLAWGAGSGGGFIFYRYSGIDGTARVIIPDDESDVTRIAVLLYAAAEVTGAGTAGGPASITPGGSVTLYTDGTDKLTIDCTAGGELHVHRAAGLDTFKLSAWVVWL